MSTLDQSRVAEIRRLQTKRDQNRNALEVADETLALVEDVGHGALSDNVTAARRVILDALGRGGGDRESLDSLPPASSPPQHFPIWLIIDHEGDQWHGAFVNKGEAEYELDAIRQNLNQSREIWHLVEYREAAREVRVLTMDFEDDDEEVADQRKEEP